LKAYSIIGDTLPGLSEAPRPDIVEEAYRIMELADEKKIALRLLGGVAVKIHCPTYKHLFKVMGRVIPDIDMVTYRKYHKDTQKMFTEMGYEEDRMIRMIFHGKRMIFYDNPNKRHLDIFIDKLKMCHEIDFQGRLELDYPTVSLIDILLSKMQIVKLNERDVIDTVVLLREHEIGKNDKETVNSEYLAKLCANDWGLWRTVTMNLQKVKDMLPKYPAVPDTDKSVVVAKIDDLLEGVEKEPKSTKWRLRAMIGEKKQWYEDVEEVIR